MKKVFYVMTLMIFIMSVPCAFAQLNVEIQWVSRVGFSWENEIATVTISPVSSNLLTLLSSAGFYFPLRNGDLSVAVSSYDTDRLGKLFELLDKHELIQLEEVRDKMEKTRAEVKKTSDIFAPLAGPIEEVLVEKDQVVAPGQLLLVMDSVLQSAPLTIRAAVKGKITEIYVEKGQMVDSETQLIGFEPI